MNLEKELKFWQEVLSLRDWDLKAAWTDQTEMPISNALACISVDYENSKAQIWVSKLTLPVTDQTITNTRENLVHELLHIHLERWDDKSADVERHRERAINQIAKGLVALHEFNHRHDSAGDGVSIAGKPARRGSVVTRAGSRNKTGPGPAKSSH